MPPPSARSSSTTASSASAIAAAGRRAARGPAARAPGSGSELRRSPRCPQAPLELVCELVDRDAVLGERVAVADRHGPVLERLVVHRHAPRRADLVVAAVAPPDRAALVVLGGHSL